MSDDALGEGGDASTARGRGQPTKYEARFCDVAADILGQGYSETVLAGECGVCIDTITEWKRVHPEFSASVRRARAKGVRFWEDRLRHVAEKGGGPGTAQSVIFGLKNRAPESWRDKQEHEHSGPDGGAIQHDNRFVLEFVEGASADPSGTERLSLPVST